MSKNDHDDHDPRPSRGSNDKPTRDARGRWLPGHCPNRSGRRGTKRKSYLEQADLKVFGNTLIEVGLNGQKEEMVRRLALLNKMFESAMKGRVTMQRYLFEKFEENDRRLAAHRVRYEQLLFEWVLDNPKRRNRGFEIPLEVEVEIDSLRALLNYYHPGQYPPPGVSKNDPRYYTD